MLVESRFSDGNGLLGIITIMRSAIFLVCLFISLCFVSADIRDFVIGTNAKSWMEVDDFNILIKNSLIDSKCCNIFVSGDSEGTLKLLQEFVKIYGNEYTVNKEIDACTGHFMISTTAKEIVAIMPRFPTTIWNIEILIIIDENIEESAEIFEISMYANAQVTIAAHDGVWILSENYLFPRKFKKISSLERTEHHQGIFNLQGQTLQVASIFFPPFCYLQTTVNQTVAGIDGKFYTFIGNEVDGVELQLFLLIADALNFTWSMKKPTDNWKYGRRNGSDWEGGLIGQIFHKEVDIAFARIKFSLEYSLFVNLTVPYGEMFHITFLVPRPKPHANFWALTTPFLPKVWFGLLAMLMVQSIYVYTSAWMHPRIPKRFRSFTITWTEMMGRLLGTFTPKEMWGLKLQFQLWHLMGVLIMTGYSSSLANRLARSDYENRIDSIQQMLEANLTWGHDRLLPRFSHYYDDSTFHGRQLSSLYEPENSNTDRHAMMLNGHYAILGNVVGATFYPESFDMLSEDYRDYRVMEQYTGQYYTTFAVQPWLLKSFNVVLLRLQESGLTTYHLNNVLLRRTPAALREVFIEYDELQENRKILQLTPLGAGFSLLFVGLLISTIVFYLELRSVSASKSIREVLHDIKRNREIRRVKELKMKRRYLAFERFIQKKM